MEWYDWLHNVTRTVIEAKGEGGPRTVSRREDQNGNSLHNLTCLFLHLNLRRVQIMRLLLHVAASSIPSIMNEGFPLWFQLIRIRNVGWLQTERDQLKECLSFFIFSEMGLLAHCVVIWLRDVFFLSRVEE